MTQLEHQVRKAQQRLWLNRWLGQVTITLGIAAGALAVTVLVHRLYGLSLPIGLIAIAAAAGAFFASIIWTAATREPAALAAAVLDRAAGLRERISSGLFLERSEDPFARAVVADAERVGGSISVRAHLRLSVPRALGLSAFAMVACALMFLVPMGAWKSAEASIAPKPEQQMVQATLAVKKEISALKKLAETNPALDDLKEELEKLEQGPPMNELKSAGDLRHEVVKGIDNVQDALQKKRDDSKYESVKEMRKMLRGLETPKDSQAPTQKLNKALAQGDFKTAQEEVKALQEQLATLKSERDKEMAEKMSKQLDELAKQIEQMAKQEQAAKALDEAGIKKEDVERMVENLKKGDLDQLKKQLEEKGMSPQQAQDLAKKMQQQQQAQAQAQQLAQSMKQAAQACNSGQAESAGEGLSQAGQQLSELEQIEQEMAQLDSAIAEAQNSKDRLDNGCSACNGTGQRGGKPCSSCNGSGQKDGQGGTGGKGQGRGGLVPESPSDVDFKMERQKVVTTKGAIIGQFLVDAEQVKGEVSREFAEVVTAAERQASDAVNRDRVPRQYQKAVKEYFSSVRDLAQPQKKVGTKKDGTEKDGTKKDESQAEDKPAPEGDPD
jgi:DNA repair exonuclease SbcCD ATPase subunit